MGYFSLPKGDTAEDFVDAAISNLELWKRTPNRDKYSYLLETFAIGSIEMALETLKEQTVEEKQQ